MISSRICIAFLFVLSSTSAMEMEYEKISGNQKKQIPENLERWEAKCIVSFLSVQNINKVGILVKNLDLSVNHALELLYDHEISAALLHFPLFGTSQIRTWIHQWRISGISYIVFLQITDMEVINKWIEIKEGICDNTHWIFFGHHQHQQQLEISAKNSTCKLLNWRFFITSNVSSKELWYDKSSGQCISSNDLQVKELFPPSNSDESNLNQSEVKEKRKIKLAVNETPPYLSYNRTRDGKIYLVDGPDVELLRVLEKELNLEYEISTSPDGEWGRIKRGKWTGLIGMLARDEVDAVSGCITWTWQRHDACLFTQPYDYQKSVIVTRIPNYKSKTYAVLQPFKLTVWTSLLATLFLFMLCLYLMSKAYQKLYSNKAFSFSQLFWYLLGTMCCEGGLVTKKISGAAAVLVLALWLLFVLVMQASYCGTLMSVLTFPAMEATVDNLHDLAQVVEKKGIKCGCRKGTINCDAMLGLEENLAVIAKSLDSDPSNFVYTVEEGLNKVLDENFAFVAQEIASVYVAQTMPDPYFYMSDEGLDLEFFSIAVRKDFPLLDDFNRIIRRVTEAGLITKWRNDKTTLNNMLFAMSKRDVPTANPLKVTELTGAFYLFAYGHALATFTLVMEKIYGKLKKYSADVKKKIRKLAPDKLD